MGALTDKCRLYWFDTKASIPAADWEEDTAYRDKYCEGVPPGGSAGDTGGGNHSHTGISHQHGGVAHVHTFTVGASTWIGKAQIKKKNGLWSVASKTHSHDSQPFGLAFATGGTVVGANTVTTQEAASPPARKAFVIKPRSGETPDIPQGAYCWADAAAPAGFAVADGAGGTEDLDGLFVFGCGSADTQGGAAYGAATHNHGQNPADHTHPVEDHQHGTQVSGDPVGTLDGVNHALAGYAPSDHNHDYNIVGGGGGTADSGVFSWGHATNKPDHLKLLAITNAGSAATPEGAIVGFEGPAVDIPAGFIECDGTGGTPDLRGKWIEGCITVGAIGDPALDEYANSHVHECNHTAETMDIHTHTSSRDDNFGGEHSELGTEWAQFVYHTHPVTIGGDYLEFLAAVATVQAEDGRAPHRRLRWIKYTGGGVSRASLGSHHARTVEILVD